MYVSQSSGIAKQYIQLATPSLGGNGELLLVLDDLNAYTYLSENKAGCLDRLKQQIRDYIAKEIEIVVRYNDTGKANEVVYADLRKIPFDIELETDIDDEEEE